MFLETTLKSLYAKSNLHLNGARAHITE